jgi:hypothetical protein
MDQVPEAFFIQINPFSTDSVYLCCLTTEKIQKQ